MSLGREANKKVLSKRKAQKGGSQKEEEEEPRQAGTITVKATVLCAPLFVGQTLKALQYRHANPYMRRNSINKPAHRQQFSLKQKKKGTEQKARGGGVGRRPKRNNKDTNIKERLMQCRLLSPKNNRHKDQKNKKRP